MNLNRKINTNECERGAHLRVAQVVGKQLQPIGREVVFVEEDMVVSWSACALKKDMHNVLNPNTSVCATGQ